MSLKIESVEVGCPLYEEYDGRSVGELSTVIYLRRAFVKLGLSAPNQDVALFSSFLDEKLECVEESSLANGIRQSVHILFYHHVTHEGDRETAFDIAGGLVGVMLLDTLRELWSYHSSEEIDQDPEILFRIDECMHDLQVMMFYARPDFDTAAGLLSSGMHMYEVLKARGDGFAAFRYLVAELDAPDYLYTNGRMEGHPFLPALATLHVIRALNIEDDEPDNAARDYLAACIIFREVGMEGSAGFMQYVDLCSKGLGYSVF